MFNAIKRPGKAFQGGAGASYRGQRIGRSDYLANGSTYNMICDRCGFKCKSTQVKREWTGFYTCDETVNNCWEPRQPQDFVRGVPDNTSVPIARPDYNPFNPNISGIALCGISICGQGY